MGSQGSKIKVAVPKRKFWRSHFIYLSIPDHGMAGNAQPSR